MPAPFYIWLGVIILLLLVPAVVAIRTARLPRRMAGEPRRPEYLPDEARRAAESLAEAIRHQTVAHAELTNKDYSQFLALRKYLRERYPLCHERLEFELVGGFSLLYRWVAPAPISDPVLLCGHLDVVPAEDGWTHGPFDGDIENGYVYGRGALDCKNVVICILEAVESLLEKGLVPSCDIYLAFGHDEETGGAEGARGMAKLFSHRGIRFSLVLDEGSWIGETLLPVGRPVANVAVSEKGMMNLRLTARGQGGHTAFPPAHTALGVLSETLGRVEFRPRRARLIPLVQDNLMSLAPYLPYQIRMYLANLWLFRRPLMRLLLRDPNTAAMLRTTVAATMSSCGTAPNVLPESAEAILNARLLPGDTDKVLLSWLQALTDDLPVDIEVLFSQPPSHISDYKGSMFHEFTRAIEDVFHDVPVTTGLLCTASDARNYEAFCDHVYRFCPFIVDREELRGMHGDNERIAVASLGAGVMFYRRLLMRLAFADERPDAPGAAPDSDDGSSFEEPQSTEGSEELA